MPEFLIQKGLGVPLAGRPAPQEVDPKFCGAWEPPPMIAAVTKMLDDLGVEKGMIAFDEF